MRPIAVVVCATLAVACAREKPKPAADTQETVAERTNPSCRAHPADESRAGNPAVEITIDSAAAVLNRMQVNAVKDIGRPFRATLAASAGSIDCSTAGKLIEFDLTGRQTSMSLTIYAPTDTVLVRLSGGGAYGGRVYQTTGTQDDLLWGEAQREHSERARLR
jgi:hypothetical protein